MAQHERGTAYYHLPGLFEFYELYRVFLPLFRKYADALGVFIGNITKRR